MSTVRSTRFVSSRRSDSEISTLSAAIVLALLLFTSGVAAQDLSLSAGDLLIEQSLDGGYDLWVRAKPGIGSVMIVESTEDPERKIASYAFRNPVYHTTNGDEKRVLNGEVLPTNHGYHLVDSSPESHPAFKEAYRIFLPYVVVYGYPWQPRNGELSVVPGMYLNFRTFEKERADYTGAWADNPFTLQVVQKPKEGPPDAGYMKAALESFEEIADLGGGTTYYSRGEGDMMDRLEEALLGAEGRTLDLVIALDTTESMTNDLPHLKERLVPMVREHTERFDRFRIGIVYYRDYFEEYLTRIVPFETDLGLFERKVRSISVKGGRDIPEAVYEALYTGVKEFPWQAETRHIILIGDAPPHPRPRGRVTEEMVYGEAAKRGIVIDTIILPQ